MASGCPLAGSRTRIEEKFAVIPVPEGGIRPAQVPVRFCGKQRKLSLVTPVCYDPRPPFQVDSLIWIRPAKLPPPNDGSVLNDARQPPHAQNRSCASLRHGRLIPRLIPRISRTLRSTSTVS